MAGMYACTMPPKYKRLVVRFLVLKVSSYITVQTGNLVKTMAGEDLSSTDLHLTNGDMLLVGQVAELAHPKEVEVAHRSHARKLQVIYCYFIVNIVTIYTQCFFSCCSFCHAFFGPAF